jgi:hypothetical protein
LRDSDSFFQNEMESDAEHCRTSGPVPIAAPASVAPDVNVPDAGNHTSLPALGRRYGGGQIMDFTRGALLWLLGVPLPIILLIALFWHH